MGLVVDGAADPTAGFRTGLVCSGLLVAALGMVATVLIDPGADRRRFS
jgi:hypothetical protein